jgi:hypothetical protein
MLTYDTPAYMFNVYKNQPSRQTGSRNLMGPKTLTTIWGTDMKPVTKYQIPVINSCWEKCNEKCAYMLNVHKSQLSRQMGSRNLMVKKRFPQNGVPIWSLWRNIRFLPSIFAEKNATKNEHIWVPKTLPTIWNTYMKLVTKYQIPVINICWEKCAYMLNVYKSQLSRQTGSRNLTGQKTLPTIWGTYMKLVTKYQISAINSCWEKWDEKCAYICSMCIKTN